MKQFENNMELIEKFFGGELDEQQNKVVTDRLDTDEQFKDLYNKEKILIKGIRHAGMQSDLAFIKTLENSFEQNHFSEKSKTLWKPLAIAASLSLFMLAYFLYTAKPETPEELFQAYFKPYPNVVDPIVRGENAINKRTEAFEAYENGDYAKASRLFNDLLKEKKEAGILLLLGNANLMLGKNAEAKENFITLSKDFDELDLQAKWFLSLCYLRSGDVENARKMLKELGETEVSYATKAKELLKKVD